MPFKSQAQRRKFAELLVEGKISNETFEEWNRETGRKKLPERVKTKRTIKRKKKECAQAGLREARGAIDSPFGCRLDEDRVHRPLDSSCSIVGLRGISLDTGRSFRLDDVRGVVVVVLRSEITESFGGARDKINAKARRQGAPEVTSTC